jgi:ABC-type uncharacterized transport system substrate-binding protein
MILFSKGILNLPCHFWAAIGGYPLSNEGQARGKGFDMRGLTAAVAAFVLLAPASAPAHPHVWVTVRSRVEFADGKVAAVVHDWVFDEMYSSFATEGLAPKGKLVTRDLFAPLAQENAGSLAELGYYTTLKLDGKTMEFAPVTEYWMEERPDHLVAFHVRLNLKTPKPVGRFGSLLVADPEFYIDFEFDDPPNGVVMDHAPDGCSNSLSKPKALETGDKQKLDESFFTNLSPGANFGIKMASRAILACP